MTTQIAPPLVSPHPPKLSCRTSTVHVQTRSASSAFLNGGAASANATN